jgi:hypothetical protein
VVRQYMYTPGSMYKKEETRNDRKQGSIAVCSSRMMFRWRDSRFWFITESRKGGARLLSTNCDSSCNDKLRKIGVRVEKTCSNLNMTVQVTNVI